MKKQRQPKPKRWGLTLSLMLFVFAVIMTTIVIVGGVVFALHRAGLLDPIMEQFAVMRQMEAPPRGRMPFLGQLLGLMAFSSLMALALTWFFGRRALNPIRKVIDATRRVAAGDFSVQVDLKGVGELEELSQSFNKMTRELHAIETLRSDFINTFSHQFKTPLMALRGFAKLLREADLRPEERQEYLDIIIAESERLASLATKTLILSKYEHVEIVADKAPFRLDEQIRRTIASIEPQWMAKALDVSVELEEVTFHGSEDLTQQVWLNLLDNAIKFSPRGGKIHVCLRRQGDTVRFTIRDEGIGMGDQAQAHCFDKFYQEDASQSKPGNGLGLAIVKRIAELQGGAVEVQSAPGQGSTFTVIL